MPVDIHEPAFFEIILIFAVLVASFTTESVCALSSLLRPDTPARQRYPAARLCHKAGLQRPVPLRNVRRGAGNYDPALFWCDLSAENGL